MFERPLDAKLQTWLNAEHGPSGPAYDRLKHACETGVAADWLVCPPGSALGLYLLPEGRIDFRTLCMTLASLWQQDRDGLQGVFLQPIARLGAKKNNAADRMSPIDHRPQGVMQRVVEGP